LCDAHAPGKQVVHQPFFDLLELGEVGFFGGDAGVMSIKNG
jgi:hypothetical protein